MVDVPIKPNQTKPNQILSVRIVQLARAEEYTNCISVEG